MVCSEALFYYFRLEDQVPESHLLRLIEKHISFAFVRERLKASYSETGWPSIDPELLLRILLIGYLYGITGERKLVEELRMHLVWRWFTGLGFDQEIPHHSTFSKNRHERMNRELAAGLTPELQSALQPLLDEIESLSERIREYNDRVRQIVQESYPEVARLEPVKGSVH